MTVKMTKAELETFLRDDFPQVSEEFSVEDVRNMGVTIRLNVSDKHLRPGGTVSGPSMFALADVSVYLATLAMIGPQALAVTTNCSIDFMRKPASGQDLLCEATLLKLGRILVVGDALVYSEGVEAPVARASLTFSIPPTKA